MKNARITMIIAALGFLAAGFAMPLLADDWHISGGEMASAFDKLILHK